jgi:hypothetical protein
MFSRASAFACNDAHPEEDRMSPERRRDLSITRGDGSLVPAPCAGNAVL